MKNTILGVALALGLVSCQPVTASEVACLAATLYHEARGEGVEGLQAVAHVALNRKQARNWPGTICGVVRQPGQFAYRPAPKNDAYEEAVRVAANALAGKTTDPTNGATYFFSGRAPGWSRGMTTTARIGGHVFKRED